VFLLGVPVMILVLLVGPKVLPEYSHQGSGRLDPLSVVLSLATILPTIYGIKQLARNGWQAVPIIAVVVGVVFGALFLRRQRRLTDPLLDLRVIANKTIGTALTGQLAYSMIGGVTMLFMMLYFQLVRGMSTIEAGAALVPGMIAGSVGFMVGPKLAGKIRPAYIIAAGLVGTALVQLVFTSVGADSGTVLLIVGFAVFAFAGAPMAGLGTSLAVGSAPPEKAGAAGSLAQMANEFGSTLGIALLGTLGTTVYRVQVADGVPAGTPSGAAASARDSLAGATNAAQGLPADVGRTLLANAHKAFTDGMHTIAVVGAVLLAAAALLIVTRLKHVPPFGQAAAQPAPAEPATEEAAVAETELAH